MVLISIENNKKPPSLWDESYLTRYHPISPDPCGSQAHRPRLGAGRPLTLDHAAPLRTAERRFRSKAVPPRPFSEAVPDRFPAPPALCSRLHLRTYPFLGNHSMVVVPQINTQSNPNIINEYARCQGLGASASRFPILPASFRGGTGSSPPGLKGWHLAILLAASQEPFKAP